MSVTGHQGFGSDMTRSSLVGVGLGCEEVVLWETQQARHGQGGSGAGEGPRRVPEAVRCCQHQCAPVGQDQVTFPASASVSQSPVRYALLLCMIFPEALCCSYLSHAIVCV